MQGIYLITNNINNKKYVGQSVHISERWAQHRYNSKNGTTRISQALRKHGIDNFTFSILEIVEDARLLTDREQYWIDYYDSINTGYNASSATGSAYGELNANTNLTNQQVLDIRNRVYVLKQPLQEVYQEFKDLISYDSFWQAAHGSTWQHLDCSMIYQLTPNTKGVLNGRALLTDNDVISIRHKIYIEKEPWREVFYQYQNQISESAFTKLMRGETWSHLDTSMIYPLKSERLGKPKAKLSKEDVRNIRNLYENEQQSIDEIHSLYLHVTKITIERVVKYVTWKNI